MYRSHVTCFLLYGSVMEAKILATEYFEPYSDQFLTLERFATVTLLSRLLRHC